MRALVDTSVLYAAARPGEDAHECATQALAEHAGTLLIPEVVLSELMSLVRVRAGVHAQRAYWDGFMKSGIQIVAAEAELLQAARRIDRMYEDAGFGFVDCVLLATCEREQCARLLTLDSRLSVYRPTFTQVLDILP